MHVRHLWLLIVVTSAPLGCGSDDDDITVWDAAPADAAVVAARVDAGEARDSGLDATVWDATTDAEVAEDAGPDAAVCADMGDPCTACMYQSCTSTYCDCATQADCQALYPCAGTCTPGDAACLQVCFAAHPDAIAAYALVGHCGATSCPSECPGFSPLSPCEACQFTSCAAEANVCLGQSDCYQLYGCLAACGSSDPSCEAACHAQYPAGVGAMTSLQTCRATSCAAPCGL